MHPTKRFVLAFPGMGKTTLAKRKPGLIDLDYGSFRTALLKEPTDDQKSVIRSFMILANRYGAEGFTVLSNEPKLMPYLKNNGRSVMVVLPKSDVDLAKRIAERYHADDGGWHGHFLFNLATHQDDWVRGWEDSAKKYGFKVYKVNYLSEVLK